MAKTKSPLFDTATTLGKIVSFFGISALAGVLVAGLFLPLGMIGGAAANTGTELLDQLPAELQEEPLSLPSEIQAKDGTVLATFYAENRTPVAYDEISQHMKDAIVAIEDERFFEHGGVDPQGLARAIVNNVTSDTTQGASTITQQYVNNVLVNYQSQNNLRTTISGTKEIPDKLREMKLSVAIEKQMTKEEILEGYLNIVLFAGRTYGVEAAAHHFFNKSAKDLNIQESAMLAGMVQSPNALNPESNPEGATARRNTVINNMEREGFIEAEEAEKARESDLGLKVTPVKTGCVSATHGSGYYCDFVHRTILNDPAFGPDKDARQRLLDRGGLTIKTTLDVKLQDEAVKQTHNHVPRDEKDGVGSSLVTVQQNTGNVLAMAQNTKYSVEEDKVGDTTLNFNADSNMGGGQGFQGGSTLKPFVSLGWLATGHKMSDRVDASRDNYTNAEFPAYCLDGGKATIGPDGWNVNNATANMKRTMPVDYGLYWSINTATVATAFKSDLCTITDIITASGIHGADGNNEGLNPANPSFVLGAQEVSPLSMATGYSTLGANGNQCNPRVLEEVTDAEGNSYEVPPVQCSKNAINPEHIKELNSTLIPLATERISRGALNFPHAGKTGTNNYESSTWFIGYTSDITTAAWVGNYRSPNNSLTGTTINGRYWAHVYGSEIAGPMWVDYMKVAGPSYETNDIPRSTNRSPRGTLPRQR